jgi:hypothetical protein
MCLLLSQQQYYIKEDMAAGHLVIIRRGRLHCTRDVEIRPKKVEIGQSRLLALNKKK